MQLKQLADWPRAVDSLSHASVLKSAKRSALGYFIILEVETEGSSQLKLLEINTGIMDKIIAVLNAHSGRTLDEIAQIEIGD